MNLRDELYTAKDTPIKQTTPSTKRTQIPLRTRSLSEIPRVTVDNTWHVCG